ncbi:MAG: hypothetical protein IPG76_00150 [Acidobacteria bacterium]|nr:hypothetical protein [Acidobacteriota bacterium]
MWDWVPKKSYSFSFATVRFEAYASGEGEIFWGPTQLNGQLRLAGEVGFRVFKKGFDLGLRADVMAKTPDWLVDADLWFGVKFKILWKKYKFGATIPFRWEKRHTPQIPELLSSIGLKHAAVEAHAAPLVLTGIPSIATPDQGLDMALVPDMEPDTYPVISFHYPTKDVTGLPFAQNVALVPNHKSGDHEFEARLEGAGGRIGIQMYRKKLGSSGAWEEFKATPPSSPAIASDGNAYLYGAWQSAEPGEGANLCLHLFARSPFEYAEMVHTDFKRIAFAYEEVLVAGTTTYSVATKAAQVQAAIQTAAASALPSAEAGPPSTPAVKVPRFIDQPKCVPELRALDKILPFRIDQYRVNEDPKFPHSGGSVSDDGKISTAPGLGVGQCRNFLNTAIGFRRPYDVIALDQEVLGPPVSSAADVYVGGYGEFFVLQDKRVLTLGNCEVVEEADAPYPLRYLEWHFDRGIDPKTDKLITQQQLRHGVLGVMLRYPIRKLIIHYEVLGESANEKSPCNGSLSCPPDFGDKRTEKKADPGPLWCNATYLKPFGPENFWKDVKPLSPDHQVDLSQPGIVVISRADRAFNAVFFNLSCNVRIYSICYVPDVTKDLSETDAQLEAFIDLTWPNRHSSGTSSGGTWCGTGSGGAGGPDGSGGMIGSIEPGPGALNLPRFYTPLAPIVPGYLYRVNVRTSHRRVKQIPEGPNVREYRAYFKVVHPPSDLTPYVGATFPAPAGFPHYRGHEWYLRMNRNYVHKLFGTENGHVTCELRLHGATRVSLPFRDDLDLNGATTKDALQTFAASVALDRLGWAWGKANGHEPTREETAWIESYNLSVPVNRQITPSMGLPDDVLWAYPVNPVLWREQFSTDATDDIPSFDKATDGANTAIAGRWKTSLSLLNHLPVGTDANGSFLLGSREITERYQMSAWLRPLSTTGKVSVVLSATDAGGIHLGKYVSIQFDMLTQRVSMIQRLVSATIVKADRSFTLPLNRWTRLCVRVSMVVGGVAVTLEQAGEQLLTALTDLDTLRGKVGFFASADYKGDFDNVEVLALDRLEHLPLPDATHQLVVRYDNPPTTSFDMYKLDFRASKYLDLFDHLNSWDRSVWRVPANSTAAVQRV